ncbi:hypothetical protein SteCoe_21161 [Stentor coeruleus]|uniref:Uncharacterized protein n=1 Tax=Stentor coeruleus TaxID=5963 RepID=A0A1R2BQ32_9CILI|nr:hypothetical protein SteCoe_21161 [Stentor coeruleus]
MHQEEKKGKCHLICFFLLSFTTLLLGIICLCLSVWIHYCWWDIGLTQAKNTSQIIHFDGEKTISEAHEDACGQLKDLVERSCPNACEYLDHFKSAGKVMIIFGSLSLIILFWCCLVVLIRLCKIRISGKFLIPVPGSFALWLIGFCAYAGTAGLGRLDSPNNKAEYNFTADEYKIKVGVAIGITTIFMQFFVGIYGWVKIRPLLNILKEKTLI